MFADRNAFRSLRSRLSRRWHPRITQLEDRLAPAVFTFQQNLNGYSGTTDTDLFSLDANTNFADNTFISVDQQDFDNVHHGLLRFGNIFTNDPMGNPDKIPLGSVINSANLTLSIINESNQAALLSLYRMRVDWNESVATWNTFGPVGGIQTDGVEAERTPDFTLGDTATQGLKNFDVVSSVQAWSNGITNHGWALIQYSSNGWDFETSEAASNQPKLVIDFTPPGGAGSFTFTQPVVNSVEGDSGTNTATVLVARQGGNAGTVSVDYEIKAGTATAGVDFDNTTLKGSLTFGPSDVFLPINIPIFGDTDIEGTENLTVTLSNPTGGAGLGKTVSSEVRIADQDVLINEVVANISNQADDGYEYIELIGTPGASLNGLQVVIFEGESEEAGGIGGSGSGVGVADLVVDLSGQTIGSNGIFVITPTNWKYTPAVGTNQLKVAALDKVGGGIEDSSLTVVLLKGGAVLTVGTDYDLDVVPAVPANNINVGVINSTDPLFGYDLLDSMGWTEMGGSDADRNIGYTVPGVRLNQPQGQKVGPADDKSTSSDAGSRLIGDKTPNNIGSWFNGDILNPNIPVAYDLPPRAYVNNPAGASVTPGEANTQRVVTFAISSYKVEEKTGSATITVDRLGDTTGTTTVTFTTQDGTAKAGQDYTAVNSSITFNPGDKTVPIVLTINSADGIPEGFESFSVKLTAAQSPFLIATATATIRIEDADAKVAAFSDVDLGYQGTQDAGIYGWSALAFGSDLTVQVDQADSNLITDPLRPDQGMIRFDNLFGNGAGQVPIGSTILNAFITFNVVSPTAASANVRLFKMLHNWDEFAATWANPTLTPGIANGLYPDSVVTEATPDGIVPTPGVAGPVDVAVSLDTVQAWANGSGNNYGWSILNDSDDDWVFVSSNGIDPAARPRLTLIYTEPAGAGVVSFSEPSYSITENGGAATVTILRTGGSTGSLTVDVAITGGNADAMDYGALSSTKVTFGPTDRAINVTLPIVNDSKLEASETAIVTISGTGINFGRATAEIVIRDNDFNPAAPTLLINEYQTNSIGQDQPFEYVEFSGAASTGAGSLYFLSIEGDNNNYLGANEFAHDLSRLTTGKNGLILVKAFNGGHRVPDTATTVDFNGLLDVTNTNALRGFDSDHTSSYLLIYSPEATFGAYYDFDWNNDGVLDLPAGAVLVDAVGQNDGGGGDIVYGGVTLPVPLDGMGAPIWIPDQVSRTVGNTSPFSAAAYFYGDHLGTDDALVYNAGLSTPLPVVGATATPGQTNAQTTTPLTSLVSVAIDDGSGQRSVVRSITLSFNNIVDRLLTDAITLTDQKGAPVAGVNLSVTGLDSTALTITFSGSPVIGGSLPDGLYRLTIDGIDLIGVGRTADAKNTGTVGSVRTVDFHRLFGDADGNGSVSATDFNAFRLAYGAGPSIFDFDNDGQTSASDFNQFRLRYGTTVS